MLKVEMKPTPPSSSSSNDNCERSVGLSTRSIKRVNGGRWKFLKEKQKQVSTRHCLLMKNGRMTDSRVRRCWWDPPSRSWVETYQKVPLLIWKCPWVANLLIYEKKRLNEQISVDIVWTWKTVECNAISLRNC